MSQDSLDKLEQSIIQSTLKDEIINLKDRVIKNLQDENGSLKVTFEKLENRFATVESNYDGLAQHGRRNIVVFSGISENAPDNKLQSTVILVLSNIDVEVEPRDIEACNQIGKSASKTHKTIVKFANKKRFQLIKKAFEIEK